MNYKVNIKFASVKSEGYYNSTFQDILNVLNVQTEPSQFRSPVVGVYVSPVSLSLTLAVSRALINNKKVLKEI